MKNKDKTVDKENDGDNDTGPETRRAGKVGSVKKGRVGKGSFPASKGEVIFGSLCTVGRPTRSGEAFDGGMVVSLKSFS